MGTRISTDLVREAEQAAGDYEDCGFVGQGELGLPRVNEGLGDVQIQ